MLKGIQLSLQAGPLLPVPVPRKVIDSLISATVSIGAGDVSYFELKFRLSQRSPLHTIFLLSGGSLPMIFRVKLIAMLNGSPEVLIDGVVTRHQVGGSGGQDQTLTVTGEDLTRVMDYIEFTGLPYPAMPIEARIAVILAKYAALGITPKIIPSIIRDFDSPLDHVAHHKGTDLEYMRLLAKHAGYTFYLEPGGPLSTTAYWGPEIQLGTPQAALSIGMGGHTNVDDLNFDLDNAKGVQPVVFIQEPITKASIPIPLPNFSPLSPPLGIVPMLRKNFKQVPCVSHLTPTKAILRGLGTAVQANNGVRASGNLDVIRYGHILKANRLVGVRGAGLAFNGLYFVESVTHQLSQGSYKQSFVLSRNALVSTVPRIPV